MSRSLRSVDLVRIPKRKRHIRKILIVCEGEKTESFFDDVDGRGTVSISIYVEGLDKTFNGKDYLDMSANLYNSYYESLG